ncbi:hypothetical protein [Streptosporangium saharense]|uniref:hypothetical protein n=1 Tax=Streptosporangium saharense TaxID=1706840 RepID=UPI003424450C
MSTSPAPLRLSAGASTGSKILLTILVIPFVGIPLFMILMVPDRHMPAGSSPFRIGYLFLLIPAVVMAIFLGGLLAAFRFRATLTGSVLEVRGAFRTRRADLATAHVWLGSTPEYTGTGDSRHRTGRDIPHLMAQDRGGPKVQLHLRLGNGYLPPEQLAALADAVASNHRTGQEADHASRTVEVLRRLLTGSL